MQHYQDMAHGHFTVRRLERGYGSDIVLREYEGLGVAAKPPKAALPPDADAAPALEAGDHRSPG